MKFSYNKFLTQRGAGSTTPEERKMARRLDGRPVFPTVLNNRMLFQDTTALGVIDDDGTLYYVPADLCTED